MPTLRDARLAVIGATLGFGVLDAAAQPNVDVNLGELASGSSTRLTGTIPGVEGGDIEVYQFGVGGEGPFGVANASERIYRFEVSEVVIIEIEENAPFTGVSDADFVLLNSLNTSLFNGGSGVGVVNNATGTLGIQPNEGRFKGFFQPGVYFLVLDPFNGVPPVAGDAAGAYDVNLVLSSATSLNCDTGAGAFVDVNLGSLAPGTHRIAGTTVGAANDVCAYADFGGFAGFFGFVSDGAELIYSFTTDRDLEIGISQNEGFLVGARHLHYLLDGLSFLPSFDIFDDGTLFGTVADSAVGFVDEDSYDVSAQILLGDAPFGVFPAGTYYLSVDGFVGAGSNGFDGPFDINLELSSGFECDDGSGFVVDQDEGLIVGDDRIVLKGVDLSLPQLGATNGICGYIGSEAGFTILPGVSHGFNEWIVRLELASPSEIEIENFQAPGVGVDHDHFLLNGTETLDGFPFTQLDVGVAAINTLAFVDEEGSLGVYLPGVYYVAIDGVDGNGVFDLDIVVNEFGGSSLPPQIDPEIECDDLGEILTAFETIDITACAGTPSNQDTLIALWNRDTGELIAADDDGCGSGVGLPSVIENLTLPEGEYMVSISGSSPVLRQRNPDGLFPLDATGILEDGLVHDVTTADRDVSGALLIGDEVVPFDVDAFDRAVFCFSVGPFDGPPPPAVDLGVVGVGPDTAFFASIDLCGSTFDTELGLFDESAALIATNNNSPICPSFQSLIDLDFDPDNTGELDPMFVGQRYYFAVARFNSDFRSGFSVTPATGAAGSILGSVNNAQIDFDLLPGEVAWFTFTVAESTNAPCSVVDYGKPFQQLDIADVIAFLQLFGANNAAADIAPPMGQWDIGDVIQFLQVFGLGCPE